MVRRTTARHTTAQRTRARRELHLPTRTTGRTPLTTTRILVGTERTAAAVPAQTPESARPPERTNPRAHEPPSARTPERMRTARLGRAPAAGTALSRCELPGQYEPESSTGKSRRG